MRTTIELQDSLFREVKVFAAEHDMSLKELFTMAIEKCIHEGDSESCRMNAPPVVLGETASVGPVSNEVIASLEADELYTKVTKFD